jgi:acyl-CoA thioester hydrolase
VSDPPANAQAFEAELRWTDFDTYAHVHTSAHTVLLENARSRFLGSVLSPLGERPEWVLVHLSLDFVAELPLNEGREAICRIGIESFGRSSLTTWEAVEAVSGRIASRAQAVIAFWDPAARATRPLTADERAALITLGVSQRRR